VPLADVGVPPGGAIDVKEEWDPQAAR